jgi:hypothetical protein
MTAGCGDGSWSFYPKPYAKCQLPNANYQLHPLLNILLRNEKTHFTTFRR